MKAILNSTFNILSCNEHLIDLLNKGYFIELGNIDIYTSNRLISGENVLLQELFNSEITPIGVGKITDNKKEDISLQWNLIKEQINNVSTNLLVITFGLISYEYKSKAYCAPILLLPVIYDQNKNSLFSTQEILLNNLLINRLEEIYHFNPQAIKRIENKFSSVASVLNIDEFIIYLGQLLDLRVEAQSYLGLIEVDYSEQQFLNNKFSKCHGIKEFAVSDFYQMYFDKIKAVTPLNLEQKYAMYLANKGESFAVNGKMGSGKTLLSLNMVADAVNSKKRVLYINQNINELNNFKKLLLNHGLKDYLVNIGYTYEDYPALITKHQIIDNKYQFIPKNFEILQERLDEYKYSEIFETLAYLKKNNYDVLIEIETELEKSEIENIYQILSRIEGLLSKVDPLNINVWKRVKTSYNAISVSEIENNTRAFYNDIKTLIENKEELILKNHFQNVDSVRDIYNLFNVSESFKMVMPCASWTSDGFEEKAYSAIDELSELIHQYNEIVNYRKNHLTLSYEYGCCTNAYNELNESKEIINKILNALYDVESLYDKANGVCQGLDELNKYFMDYFKERNNLDKNLNFYLKLNNFLSNGKIRLAWERDYLKNSHEFENQKELINNYQKYCSTLAILRAILNNNFIDYSILLELNLNKSNRSILSQLNKLVNKIQLDNTNYSLVVGRIKEVKDLGDKISQNYRYLIPAESSYDEEWARFYQFVNFVISLNSYDERQFKVLLNDVKTTQNIDASLLKKNLSRLERIYHRLDNVIDDFKPFNIKINAPSILGKVEQVKENNQIIKKYVVFKTFIRQIFVSNDISLQDILELIDNEKKFKQITTTDSVNKDNYVWLFGESYKLHNTDLTAIIKSITQFRTYKRYISSTFTLKGEELSILIPDFIKSVDEIRPVVDDWEVGNMDFISCFFGRMPYYQLLPLHMVLDNLQKYIDKISQLPDVYSIVSLLERIKKNNIYSLTKLILDSELTKDLKEIFVYSTFNKMYQKIISNNKNLDVDKIFAAYEDNYEYEKIYCNNNIAELEKGYHHSNKKIASLNAMNGLNNLFETRIVNSSVSKRVFLADGYTASNLDFNYHNFDLVIVDDAHLEAINKYGNIYDSLQLIILGDKNYQPSIFNGLMQRTQNENVVNLTKYYNNPARYLTDSISKNQLSEYLPNNVLTILPTKSIDSFIDLVVNNYFKHQKLAYIMVKNVTVYAEIYRLLANKILSLNKDADLCTIMQSFIITNNDLGNGTFVYDAYVYIDDIMSQDEYLRKITLQRIVSENIYLCYNQDRITTDILHDILKTTSTYQYPEVKNQSIKFELYKAIKSKGIHVIPGYGLLDLIIPFTHQKKGIAIYIVDGKTNTTYCCYDEYLYQKQVYGRDYQFIIISSNDLFVNFDRVMEKIMYLYGEGNVNK